MSCSLSTMRHQLDEMQKLADNMGKTEIHVKSEKALDVIKRHIVTDIKKLKCLNKAQMSEVISTIEAAK